MASLALAFDVLARDKASKVFDKVGDSADNAGKRGEGFGKKMGKAMLAGTAIVAGGALLATKALYSIGETFDGVSDTIRVGTGATGKNLDALVTSAKNIGTKVPAEFDKIGAVVADVNTRLGLTGPTLETFSSQVLEAGRIMGKDLDVNKLSAAFSTFSIKGEGTTHAMDRLFRVSQATGVGMDELAQTVTDAAPAMKQLGFSFDATTALAGNLDKAGLNSSKVMAGMGKALVTLAKEGEKPQDAFKRVTKEMSGFLKKGDDAKAIDIASKLFGTRNAPQFVDALKSGALNMDDLSKVAGITGDTILGAGKETMDFAEQWKIFKNNVLVKLEPIASRVFGLISDAMKWLVDNGIPAAERFGATLAPVFQSVWDKVKVVFTGIRTVIETVVTFVSSFWKSKGDKILADGQSIFGQVQATISTVFGAIKVIVSSVLGWIQTFWQAWGGRISSFLGGLFETVKKIISGALEIVRGIFNVFAGIFTGDWSRVWNGLTGIFSGAWKILKAAVAQQIENLKLALSLAWGAISTVAEKAWGGIVTAVKNVWGGLVDAISGPVRRVMQFIQENLIDKINGLFAFLHIPIKISAIWKASNTSAGAFVNAGRGSGKNSQFADGGVMPGYTPRRDVHQFTSPTGGNLALSGGEAIMVPEWTRAMGGPGEVARQNNAARRGQAFAGGGVWGAIKGAWNTLTNPAQALKDLFAKVINGVGNNPLARIAGGLMGKGLGGLVDKIKSLLTGSQVSETAGGGAAIPAGTKGLSLRAGVRLDADTMRRIAAAAGSVAMRVIQGSWQNYYLSGGTHRGSGAADLLASNWSGGVAALRRQGLLAMFRNWSGNQHIHALNPNIGGLSPEALGQVAIARRNGGQFSKGGIFGRAAGGPVRAGGAYAVGDNRDGSWNATTELFVPDRAGRVYNQDQLRAASAPGRGSGGEPVTLSPASITELAAAIQAGAARGIENVQRLDRRLERAGAL